jgi:hypothetical protein
MVPHSYLIECTNVHLVARSHFDPSNRLHSSHEICIQRILIRRFTEKETVLRTSISSPPNSRREQRTAPLLPPRPPRALEQLVAMLKFLSSYHYSMKFA